MNEEIKKEKRECGKAHRCDNNYDGTCPQDYDPEIGYYCFERKVKPRKNKQQTEVRK